MNLQDISRRHRCDQCSGTYGIEEAEDVSLPRLTLEAVVFLVLFLGIPFLLWLLA